MPFEFTILDALQALRCPVLDALAVFFDAAGAHGELWIALTVLALAFRRTRKAGFAMALALCLYMVSGHFILKPLFARPRPCDIRPEMLTLVARPHGWSFPSGHTASGFAAAFALWFQNRRLGVPALVLAAFIGFPGCTSTSTSPLIFWAASRWALPPGPSAPCWRTKSATDCRTAKK